MTQVARGEAPEWLDVSRETLVKLDALLSLVEKWNPAINLVARGSLADGWHRHILDSAQLHALIPIDARVAADFGSGAGFPGLVLAILSQERLPHLRTTLIESDRRKAAFLVQAIRQLGLDASVLTERAELLAPVCADVLSARALAPLSALCGLAARHLAATGTAIFPKGAQADRELAEAAVLWRFEARVLQSQTDPEGRLMILKNIRRD